MTTTTAAEKRAAAYADTCNPSLSLLDRFEHVCLTAPEPGHRSILNTIFDELGRNLECAENNANEIHETINELKTGRAIAQSYWAEFRNLALSH